VASRFRVPKIYVSLGWLSRLTTLIVVAAVGALLALVTIAGFGMVAGEEFCPHTFARRSFVFYRIPLVRLQITPVFRDNATNRLERYLTNIGLLPQPPAAGVRWDVVRAGGAGAWQWQGEASILCNYLDQQLPDGNYVWLQWSKDHPELAKRLWPAVARAARSHLYTVIPDLMRLSEQTDSPHQLAQLLDSRLVEQYVWYGQIHQQLADHSAALDCFRAALTLDRDSAAALRGRELSRAALQQPESPTSDPVQPPAAKALDRP
jgi:tetratricopeptide (TPR) repeat protein